MCPFQCSCVKNGLHIDLCLVYPGSNMGLDTVTIDTSLNTSGLIPSLVSLSDVDQTPKNALSHSQPSQRFSEKDQSIYLV